MKVEHKGHTTIIKDTQNDLPSFIIKVGHEFESNNKNLIIDLSFYQSLQINDILLFSNLRKTLKAKKKSLVIVVNTFNFNDSNTKKIIVVPSIQEAHDIIEMEEIERDLGF